MKTIHFDEMRQTGRILREMRQGLHESPEELARIAGLTRVQLGELEKGTWGGAWNKIGWEEAKERYFQALAAVEKRNTTPPPSPRRSRGNNAAIAWLLLSAGLACTQSTKQPTKRPDPSQGER